MREGLRGLAVEAAHSLRASEAALCFSYSVYVSVRCVAVWLHCDRIKNELRSTAIELLCAGSVSGLLRACVCECCTVTSTFYTALQCCSVCLDNLWHKQRRVMPTSAASAASTVGESVLDSVGKQAEWMWIVTSPRCAAQWTTAREVEWSDTD